MGMNPDKICFQEGGFILSRLPEQALYEISGGFTSKTKPFTERYGKM